MKMRICLFSILVFSFSGSPVSAGLPGVPGFFNLDPCLTGSVAIGTHCKGVGLPGDTIYAGVFTANPNGAPRKIMITPGNCTDSATPVCDNQQDTLTKAWDNSGGASSPADTVSTADTSVPANVDGDVNSSNVVVDAKYEAIEYCRNMDYGGYTDWYLPSKSELTYLLCQSRDSYSGGEPAESAGCAGYGGATTKLLDPGGTAKFISQKYWSSTETEIGSFAWDVYFFNGVTNFTAKNTAQYVRCIRSYY